MFEGDVLKEHMSCVYECYVVRCFEETSAWCSCVENRRAVMVTRDIVG